MVLPWFKGLNIDKMRKGLDLGLFRSALGVAVVAKMASKRSQSCLEVRFGWGSQYFPSLSSNGVASSSRLPNCIVKRQPCGCGLSIGKSTELIAQNLI